MDFFQVRQNYPRDSVSMMSSNQITRILLQKVQSVKLGLSKPCCLICNYVICRICANSNLSSIIYSGHHNHVYPCTLPDDLPEAILSETRQWAEALLRNHLTSFKFQDRLQNHLKSRHLAKGSTASKETDASISPELPKARLFQYDKRYFRSRVNKLMLPSLL